MEKREKQEKRMMTKQATEKQVAENHVSMELNKALKRMRRDRKMTQVQLAKHLGISTFTLIRWERGERTPSGASLGKISKALNCWMVLDADGTWSYFPKEAAPRRRAPAGADDIFAQSVTAVDRSAWNAFFRRLTRENEELESWLRSSEGGAGLDEKLIRALSRVVLALVREE